MTTVGTDGSVEFRFLRPAARSVAVVGDFNGWAQPLPMRRDASGWWTIRIAFQPGDYRFRYVADGKWYTDFAANGVEFAKQEWNSLLVIPARPAPHRRSAEVQQYKQFDGEVLRVA